MVVTFMLPNTAHTSEVDGTEAGKLETDQAKWDLFAEGSDWKNNWEINTVYKVNDIVKYGGNIYHVIHHTLQV